MGQLVRGRRWLLLLLAAGLAVWAASSSVPALTRSRPPNLPRTHARVRGDSAGAPGLLGAAVPVTPAGAARHRFSRLALPAGWSASLVALRSGSLQRSYLVVRSAPVAGAHLPVVLLLAGRGLSPALMERLSGFPAVTGPAILVYPAGYDFSWNAGACCGRAQAAGINDVAFLNEVIRHVLATQPDVASGQIYVVGYSNGGRMAYRMACSDPGVFAGMAAVEAVPVAPCTHLVPLPVTIVASSGDPLLTIPYGGPPKVVHGYVEPTVVGTVTAWRTLDGCYGPPTTEVQGRATTRTWGRCRGRGRLQFTLYAGGTHAWPAGEGATLSAQQEVWRFLRSSPRLGPALGLVAR